MKAHLLILLFAVGFLHSAAAEDATERRTIKATATPAPEQPYHRLLIRPA